MPNPYWTGPVDTSKRSGERVKPQNVASALLLGFILGVVSTTLVCVFITQVAHPFLAQFPALDQYTRRGMFPSAVDTFGVPILDVLVKIGFFLFVVRTSPDLYRGGFITGIVASIPATCAGFVCIATQSSTGPYPGP